MTGKQLPYLVVDIDDNFHLLYSHALTLSEANQQAEGTNGTHIYVPLAMHCKSESQLDEISNLVSDRCGYSNASELIEAVRGVLSRPRLVGVEVQTIPVLCTSHLDQYTSENLTALGNMNPWAPCAAWDHGFFLHLDQLEDNISPVPQCLTDVRNWRLEQEAQGKLDNSRWVRFDSQADPVEGLPTYEW